MSCRSCSRSCPGAWPWWAPGRCWFPICRITRRRNAGATWCARATLLVLEASIKYPSGWTKYYYPVQLGAGPLLSNKQYRVNLTIHRPGSLDPNHPVTFDDVTPVITVSDWESGDRYDREI